MKNLLIIILMCLGNICFGQSLLPQQNNLKQTSLSNATLNDISLSVLFNAQSGLTEVLTQFGQPLENISEDFDNGSDGVSKEQTLNYNGLKLSFFESPETDFSFYEMEITNSNYTLLYEETELQVGASIAPVKSKFSSPKSDVNGKLIIGHESTSGIVLTVHYSNEIIDRVTLWKSTM